MTVLFWDIDGTLLTTGRAGIFAWEDAVLEVTGRRVDFSSLETAGLPDTEIARKALLAADVLPDEENAGHLLGLYERYLPGSLPKKRGRVLPGVREILERLRERPDIFSMLLTGNTRNGARAKLEYYGLLSYFEHGAFADGHRDRLSIARAAVEVARKVHEDAVFESMYVIGDTPHDIHCGNAIGARPIAVATGEYSASQLARHNPWFVFEQLPEPNIFTDFLEREQNVVGNQQS